MTCEIEWQMKVLLMTVFAGLGWALMSAWSEIANLRKFLKQISQKRGRP